MADNDDTTFNIDEPDFGPSPSKPKDTPLHTGGYRVPPALPADRPAPGESLNDFYARVNPQAARATTPATPAPTKAPESTRNPEATKTAKESKAPKKSKAEKTAKAPLTIEEAVPEGQQPRQGRSWLTIILICLLLAGIGAVWLIFARQHREAVAQEEQIEQLQLANQQLALQNDYDALNKEFEGYENQTRAITNDTALMRVQEKYNAAKLKVEALLKELKDTKNKSAAQISKLNDEIATLKGILRHYVEEIDRLSKENAALREENTEIKNENASLSSQVASTSAQNKKLSERMTLAEKLNVTGLSLQALNGKNKREKKVNKAKQLVVTFTIPQNNSTPVGQKTIYMRLTSPTGQLLGERGTFPFEGGAVPYTERKYVEYAGEEVAGIPIYWNVNTALTPGEYTVELFTDGYRLASRHFTL